MYYRYKSRKRSDSKYKIITIIVLASLIIYPLYRFRDHLQIWKYSLNKIEKQIMRADEHQNAAQKRALLEKAVSMCNDYEDANPLTPDTYYLEGRAWYYLAEAGSGSGFTEFVIDDKRGTLSDEANAHFIRALQNLNKGISLDSKTRPDDNVLIVLSRTYFYLSYFSSDEIRKVLDQIRTPSALRRIDDRRFYGFMKIMGGDPEGGVRFLVDYADIKRDLNGRLFLASAYSFAKQYTNAIVEYKSILETKIEPEFTVKARTGLGRVYLSQQLSREAFLQAEEAVKIDPLNVPAKLLLARVYIVLGDKISAKKITVELAGKGFDSQELRDISKGL